ncbi:MAG: hypothetical protein SZ59_C0002G0166 [candidate division TM6 bacterium GW2011_GWF2_28_16]|nr:MAG: hypothetical protein SZ59_C0002G0166 [candidate division TM6 bacterium GW2011_GWF2_28_16]
MQKNSRASILIFTLLILSVITILTEQLVRIVLVNYSFTSGQIKKEQARALALGAVNLAISQLLDQEIIDKKENEKDKSEDKEFKLYLKRVFPHINKMQKFKLNNIKEGLDGEVGFCISCENGKININKVFDFEKNEFKDDYKKLLVGLEIKGKLKPGEILKKLTEFLRERKRPLDDVSQLVGLSDLSAVDLFYLPPVKAENKEKAKPNTQIYLQDLFTTYTDNEGLEFLFLSNSLLNIFGLRQPLFDDAITLDKKFNKIISTIKKDYVTNLIPSWEMYSPIFGKNNKVLDAFKQILSKEFGPKVFSVLSYGKVDNIEERLVTVIKETETKNEEKETAGNLVQNQNLAKPQEQESNKVFKIIRMYWI